MGACLGPERMALPMVPTPSPCGSDGMGPWFPCQAHGSDGMGPTAHLTGPLRVLLFSLHLLRVVCLLLLCQSGFDARELQLIDWACAGSYPLCCVHPQRARRMSRTLVTIPVTQETAVRDCGSNNCKSDKGGDTGDRSSTHCQSGRARDRDLLRSRYRRGGSPRRGFQLTISCSILALAAVALATFDELVSSSARS